MTVAPHDIDPARFLEDHLAQASPDLLRDMLGTFINQLLSADAVDSGRKPGITSDEHKELVELRRRNRVLEMEIEILKRASAYFARENVLPK